VGNSSSSLSGYYNIHLPSPCKNDIPCFSLKEQYTPSLCPLYPFRERTDDFSTAQSLRAQRRSASRRNSMSSRDTRQGTRSSYRTVSRCNRDWVNCPLFL